MTVARRGICRINRVVSGRSGLTLGKVLAYHTGFEPVSPVSKGDVMTVLVDGEILN